MKKFVLYTLLGLAIVAALFTYILYSEGAFDRPEPRKQGDLQPFMKCESGKCAQGKCGGNIK